MAFLSTNLYSQHTAARADDIFTTTLLDYRREFIDQVFDDSNVVVKFSLITGDNLQ